MQYNRIDLSTNAFSLGGLLGTSSSADFIKSINVDTGGGTYYGDTNDPFRNNYMHFMQHVVQPIRDTQVKLLEAKMTIEKPDTFRTIDSVQELETGVPPCMWPGILTFEPVRKLAVSGRIEAFGVDVSNYPTEDVYGRLIDNGTVMLVPENIKDRQVELVYEHVSTDPVLTMDELEHLENTRIFLEGFLLNEDTMHLDPTSIPYGELRG